MADQNSDLAQAIQDVTQRVELLVREEVALAKAEMTVKISRLVKGAVFGIVAGVFAVFALVYLLHSLSWGIASILGNDNPWLGFLIVGVLLIIFGAIGGFIAMRMIKKGTQPTPQMAIEEAQLIKGTLTSPPTGQPVGPVGARHAPQPAPQEVRR
jgi:uncharacterized membrane protein YqjE